MENGSPNQRSPQTPNVPKGAAHLILILALSLLLIAGIGYYAYKNGQIKINSSGKNNSDGVSTSDDGLPSYSENYYGTFINPYHNYSIKLSEGWSAYISNTETGVSSVAYVNYTGYNDYEGGFRIGTENLYKYLSFKKNAEEWRNYYMSSTAELGNFRPQVINEEVYNSEGRSGLKYKISYLMDNKKGEAYWIFLPLSDDKLLYIKYGSTNPELLKKFDQILSTFQFTN